MSNSNAPVTFVDISSIWFAVAQPQDLFWSLIEPKTAKHVYRDHTKEKKGQLSKIIPNSWAYILFYCRMITQNYDYENRNPALII